MSSSQPSSSTPLNLVVFSHGKETGPWGRKIKHLADVAQAAGWQVLSVDYAAITGIPDAPAQDRLAALLHMPLPAYQRLVLVGSSMGGWVSTAAARTLHPEGLFLLAPAIGMADYPSQWPDLPNNTALEIIHGWRDDVIPVQHCIDYAQRNHARLTVLDDDHRLGESLDVMDTLFKEFLKRL